MIFVLTYVNICLYLLAFLKYFNRNVAVEANEVEFICSQPCSGPCLKPALRCNGQPDCEDHSDEDFCGPATPTPLCPPGEFQCASGKCLVVSRVCDGRLDCGFADGSDEQGKEG